MPISHKVSSESTSVTPMPPQLSEPVEETNRIIALHEKEFQNRRRVGFRDADGEQLTSSPSVTVEQNRRCKRSVGGERREKWKIKKKKFVLTIVW